jgi:16S rRNA (uracil1498-N3)-methyltransferase
VKRLFVDASDILGDEIHIYDKGQINHLLHVLRMKIGDALLVFDGAGMEYSTEIIEIAETKKPEVVLGVKSARPFERFPKTAVTLFQGIPKGQKFDEIVRKSTELGVYRIVPLETARVVAEIRQESFEKKRVRLNRIAEEAAKQSRRGDVPEVAPPVTVAGACERIAAGTAANERSLRENAAFDAAILLYELEDGLTLKQALRRLKPEAKWDTGLNIALLIGPEGGFEEAEASLLTGAGAISVTVGDTILRTETAGPAALAMLLYELEL